MRKLMLTALMAAVAIPGVAVPSLAGAQSYREVQQDRRDVREDRRDLNRDRREVRRDQYDRNHRWGANDWRDWRGRNRALYARGDWRAPFRYQTFRPGVRIASTYWNSSRYWIADPWRYRLPPAANGQRWVRHYDDVILVDTRRGVVIRTIPGFYW